MRKLKAKKIADYTDKLHLFEPTSRYVADEAIRTNKSRAVVIRELTEEARIARVSGKQMSLGLLKPVRAAQKEIVETSLNESVAAPLGDLRAQLQEISAELAKANEQLRAAAAAMEWQRTRLKRIFYMVRLVWSLSYNFALSRLAAAHSAETAVRAASSSTMQLPTTNPAEREPAAAAVAARAAAVRQLEQWTSDQGHNQALVVLGNELFRLTGKNQQPNEIGEQSF